MRQTFDGRLNHLLPAFGLGIIEVARSTVERCTDSTRVSCVVYHTACLKARCRWGRCPGMHVLQSNACHALLRVHVRL